jgi:deoxyadenosine/deoxycytidine kinase
MSKIISIEGNIGSGKSTILRELKEYLSNNIKIVFLQEPVDQWETIKDVNGNTILKKFYENQKEYSFAFQMMAYISRLSLLKKAIENNPDAIIITERCLNTDRYVFAKMLYDDGLIEDVEYQIYLKWFEHFFDTRAVQKLVYLKTQPEICLQRVNKRMRDGESTLSIEYLEKCHKYHTDMVANSNCDILQIDSNIDTDIDNDIKNKWLNMIETFILN